MFRMVLLVLFRIVLLLRFTDLFGIEKYFQVAYLEYRDLQQTFFQLKFIKSNIDKDLSVKYIVYMTEIRGLFEKGKHIEDSNGTKEHEKLKKRKRIHERKKPASSNSHIC